MHAFSVSSFNVSPRFLQILQLNNLKPKDTHKLSYYRTSLLTGSPVKPDLYEFIRSNIKDIYIHNGSGGTDVCAAFISGNLTLPIYAGELQGPEMGVAIECWNDNGERCPDGIEGDLVITKPMPNMPLGFIGDDAQKTRFRDTYFNHFPGKQAWYQADFSKPVCLCVKRRRLSRADHPCSGRRPENEGYHHAWQIRWCFEPSRCTIRLGRTLRNRRGDEGCVSINN